MWYQFVLVLMGFWWASPDRKYISMPIKIPQGLRYMGHKLKNVGPMCVGSDVFFLGKPTWDTFGYALQIPTRFQLYGPHFENMWDRCVLVLIGFGWASPDGKHIIVPMKIPQGLRYLGPTHLDMPFKNQQGFSYMVPTLKKKKCWTLVCVGIDGFLVGKPRWYNEGCAHPEPTKHLVYRPNIEHIWETCLLLNDGFLVGQPSWGI